MRSVDIQTLQQVTLSLFAFRAEDNIRLRPGAEERLAKILTHYSSQPDQLQGLVRGLVAFCSVIQEKNRHAVLSFSHILERVLGQI